MKIIYHPANSRGNANIGWLQSRHSFSFGSWYSADRVHFGALRVLNDDTVLGGQGFGKHPHDNMEIVSIPLSGALAHSDSAGNSGIIKSGDVQIMSAGSGIAHSEFNASKTDSVHFLQIWVFPKLDNIKPRYDQKYFDPAIRQDAWQVVVSPAESDGGLWINQDAFFSLAKISANSELTYKLHKEGNGVYLFLLEGQLNVQDQILNRRDAAGISDANEFSVTAHTDSEVLAIEVPMLK
jgi:quercetin 2,3-dioxygenase